MPDYFTTVLTGLKVDLLLALTVGARQRNLAGLGCSFFLLVNVEQALRICRIEVLGNAVSGFARTLQKGIERPVRR